METDDTTFVKNFFWFGETYPRVDVQLTPYKPNRIAIERIHSTVVCQKRRAHRNGCQSRSFRFVGLNLILQLLIGGFYER